MSDATGTGIDIQTFDFSVDLLKALLWEYNDAANLQSLLQSKQDWYNTNQTTFWNDWLVNVFDLRTANEFGLNVWAIILGIPTSLFTQPAPPAKTPWGFDVTNTSNFNNYNFSSEASQNIAFTIAEIRLILQLQYRKLVARGNVPEVNKILHDLIEPIYGRMYVLDGLQMNEKLVSTFPIPYQLGLILTEFDLIPRPAGVQLQIIDASLEIFGFGPTNQNFGNGTFATVA